MSSSEKDTITMKTQKKTTPRTVRYGYRLDQRTGTVTKDAEEQRIITRIVLDHWTGLGFGRIATGLTADGITAPGGGDKWHGSGVERVWDRVTNGQMKRIEREDAEAKKATQEAFDASEAGQVAAELQRRQDPEVQLERKGVVEMDTSIVNVHTGKVIKERSRTFDGPEWDQMEARRKAEEASYKAMTARQRAEAHQWRDPVRVEAGKSLHGVDQVVERGADKAGEEANYWCDQIANQSTVKRGVRNAIKLLVAELAIARQVALHFQQRAEKAKQGGDEKN